MNAHDVAKRLVDVFGDAIENDEEINGADAVDQIVELYQLAKEALSAKPASSVDDICNRLLDSEEHATESAVPQVAEDAVEILRALDAERSDLAARLETYQAAKDSGGLRYWAVTGRIPGDDEDTLYVFHVATLNEAMDAFAEAIWEDEMDAEVSRDAVIREYGQPAFLNSVVVSDSPIEKF